MAHSLHWPVLRAYRARRSGRPAATALVLATLLAAPLGGCSAINSFDDPVAVGDWFTNSLTAGGNRSTLAVDLDGEGRAKLWYVVGQDTTAYQDSFELDWEQTKAGDTRVSFQFEMHCKSSTLPTTGCAGHDFTMKCEAPCTEDDESCDEMTCPKLGSGFWGNIEFKWERD